MKHTRTSTTVLSEKSETGMQNVDDAGKPCEPQDDKGPNAIQISKYRRLFSKLPRLGVSIMAAGVITTTSSWVINSNGQVRQRMDKLDSGPRFSNANISRHQQTYDFSTMYTTLKLESPPGDGSKDSRGMKEMIKKCSTRL